MYIRGFVCPSVSVRRFFRSAGAESRCVRIECRSKSILAPRLPVRTELNVPNNNVPPSSLTLVVCSEHPAQEVALYHQATLPQRLQQPPPAEAHHPDDAEHTGRGLGALTVVYSFARLGAAGGAGEQGDAVGEDTADRAGAPARGTLGGPVAVHLGHLGGEPPPDDAAAGRQHAAPGDEDHVRQDSHRPSRGEHSRLRPHALLQQVTHGHSQPGRGCTLSESWFLASCRSISLVSVCSRLHHNGLPGTSTSHGNFHMMACQTARCSRTWWCGWAGSTTDPTWRCPRTAPSW